MAAWSGSRSEDSMVEREGGGWSFEGAGSGDMDVVEDKAARASQEDFSASRLLSN